MKFNELANNSDIGLIKISRKSIVNISEYISSGKSRKIKPIGSSFKNKRLDHFLELSFGMISSSRYIDIETMNIISFNVEMNKVLANNANSLFHCCLNN